MSEKKMIAARLPKSLYVFLLKIGDGSVTEGIKRLCYAYMEEK